MNAPALGVALTGHWLSLAQILRLARRADELGYAVVLVDGDTTLLPRRASAPIYDTAALTARVLATTTSARIGSIRLPGFWNTALLARNLLTLQQASHGRALGFLGAGAGRHAGRLGMPQLSPRARVERLEETLDALRPLLAGEEVTRNGRYVQLERAFVGRPSEPIPLVVAAAGPRALSVAERYADVWDANVPPLRERLEPLREQLTRALETWIWVFARPGAPLEAVASAYRRHCPWFGELPEKSLAEAVLWGEPERCRERLAALTDALGVSLPILDLTALDERAALVALEALAPAKAANIS